MKNQKRELSPLQHEKLFKTLLGIELLTEETYPKLPMLLEAFGA